MERLRQTVGLLNRKINLKFIEEKLYEKILKYNLEIMTVILLVFAVATVILWQDMSLTRKPVAGFMLVYILHEWEECRFPGGFLKLFFGRFGISPKTEPEKSAYYGGSVTFGNIACVWIFDGVGVFILVPIFLSLFEGFIHTAGIKLMKIDRPYTPGMTTACIAFIYAIFSIRKLNVEATITVSRWIIGIVLTIVTFFIMQRFFIGVAGYSYKKLIPIAKKNILGR